MDTIETCLAGCPCVDSLAQRRKWILDEYDKLDTSRLQATLQLKQTEDTIHSQNDTIVLLRTMNSILSSRIEKVVSQLAEERRANSYLRTKMTLNEDTPSSSRSGTFSQSRKDMPLRVQAYF